MWTTPGLYSFEGGMGFFFLLRSTSAAVAGSLADHPTNKKKGDRSSDVDMYSEYI